MGILYSVNPLEWRLTDGIVVAEQTAAAGATLQGNTTVQLLSVFPWGPADEIIKVENANDFKSKLLGEASDYASYAGARAIENKTFGKLEVVRVVAADAAKATRVIGANGYSVTAKHYGAAGNQIQTLHTDNGDDTFNIRISWGGYVKTYVNVTLATVEALSDDYVVFALAGTGDTLAATDSSAVALSSGSNGTAVDADWTGSAVSVRGLRALENGAGRITCVAGYSSAALITALRSHVELLRGFGVMNAVASLTDFDAAAAAAALIDDERLSLTLHGVRVIHNGVEYTTDLAPFVASMLSQMPQHYSLADADFCRNLLKSIVGPAASVALTRPSFITADESGGLMLEPLRSGGHKFHANLTTSTTTGKELVSTRRVLDLTIDTIVAALEPVQNKPNMPAFNDVALGQIKSAGELLKGTPSIPQTAFIQGLAAQLAPPLVTGDTIIKIAVSLWGEIRYLILNLTSGILIDADQVAAA